MIASPSNLATVSTLIFLQSFTSGLIGILSVTIKLSMADFSIDYTAFPDRTAWVQQAFDLVGDAGRELVRDHTTRYMTPEQVH